MWRGGPSRAVEGEFDFEVGAGETRVEAEPLAKQRGQLVLLVARVGRMSDVASHFHESEDPLGTVGKTDARRARRPGRRRLHGWQANDRIS